MEVIIKDFPKAVKVCETKQLIFPLLFLFAFVIKKRANFIKYFIESIGQMFYYDYLEIDIKTIPKK